MANMQEARPETAAAAMAHAVEKNDSDTIRAHIAALPGKGKRGYPTLYRDTMPALVYEKLSDPKRCWTLKALAALLGVYEQTLFEWIEKHERLQFAIYAGRAVQEVNFGSMLLHGFKYSSGVEYILTNLHNWTLKQKTEHALDLNAAIAAQEKAKVAAVWDEASAQGPKAEAQRGDAVPVVVEGVRVSDDDYKG